jgi:outer membrane receptor protein involved in Fe transport
MRHTIRNTRTVQPQLLAPQRRRLLACAMASCLAVAGTTANAQSTAAALRGQVTVAAQPSAAQITATNTETGFTRTVKSNDDGSYSLLGLPPGTYKVDAEADGKISSQTVTLRVGQTATLDLPVETELEAVEVVASQMVETRTSEIATYVSQEQIAALPQNSRNFLAFADTVPGVQFETLGDGSTRLRGGGQSSNGINVFIDGVGQKNYVLKGGISGQDTSRGNPFPQMAIAEYKVITQNYKAEFDQLSSAAVTAVTRSGTNEFQGSVFYDRTSDDWRASTPRELSADSKTETKDEQYGVSFSGPIVRDLLHFFVSYEAKKRVDPREINPGEGVPITALPPELAAQAGLAASPFEEDLFFGKLSWAPGDAHLVEFSVKYRDESELAGIGGVNTAEYGSTKDTDETRLDLHHQFSGENFLNDAHLIFEDSYFNPRPITDAPGYRLVTRSNDRRTILNSGGGADFQEKGQRGWGIQNDLTFFGLDWNGDHTIKMGAKYKSVNINSYEQQPYNPQFDYDIRFSTTIPYQVQFGASVPGSSDRNVESRNKQFGIYLQDDWAVNERLMLNLGLRWDYEETPSYLDHVTPVGVAAALRGWSNIQNTDYDIENFISDGSNRDAFKDAWAPRLGFSYDLSDDETHVIFGGAGRSYDRNLFDYLALEQLKGTFPAYTYRFNAPGNPCTGNDCLAWDPMYFNETNLIALVAANPNLGGELNMIANDLKTPYSDQFSLGMRNAFGAWNSSVTLSHVRSHDGIVFALGNRYPDGSFRPAGTTWGGQPWGFPVPGYGTLILADNGIETRLNSLLVSVDKPYTQESGWGTTFAYTFSDAEENRPNAAAGDEHYVFDYASVDQIGWKRSLGIARHRLVVTGMMDGPWGMMYSAKATLESPGTYDAVNCFDASDFNHCFFDPYTAEGTFGRKQFDLAASKDWAFGDDYRLNFRLDVLNVFNTRNWNEFSNWRGGPGEADPNFGNRGEGILLPTRTVKASLGFNW